MKRHKGLKIGIALGSGGARGWCHIGVLRELAEMDIHADVIAGASMGALVGAVHAGGALDALEDWARNLTARSFFGLLDIRLTSGGLFEGEEIRNVIGGLDMPENIEDLQIPLSLVATDMATGREAWLTKGNVAEAVRASVALPGILSPVLIDGRWMLDGGLTNPVPVSSCRVLGADVVIAVNPSGRFSQTFWAERQKADTRELWDWRERLPEALRSIVARDDPEDRPPDYLDVLSASIEIMTDHIRRSRLAGDPPHILLDAHLMDMSVLEFHRAEEAIEAGRKAVRDNAEALAKVVGL
ncbi:patatin-like phospholipase family protein [Silicimonas sp. MF1-12-2]|uniref:patatin-like phospholipase family protein n=1 Tax=Silicimonas sp. MF1-12-2 TaxID=3384793 RepID=UPI0039B69519